MKKISIVLAILLALSFLALCSCTNTTQTPTATPDAPTQQATADPNAPAEPAGAGERVLLTIYKDGNTLNENGYAYSDIKDALYSKRIDGVYHYGASVMDMTDLDLSDVQGAFLEGTDGYISYVNDINELFLAAYTAEEGPYESVELDGQAVYGGVAGQTYNKGVVNVYLVTTPAAFEVEIQIDGEKVGVLTFDDFMKKTMVNEEKVSTAMFEGSFLCNYGADTYQGRFLGIDYPTMIEKIKGLGLDIPETIQEVEYYGINGLGNEGKNTEYSTKEGDDKYFGSVDFFCMYDGKTYNTDTRDTPIGLTVFINGTGGRWMTFNLTTINFVTE